MAIDLHQVLFVGGPPSLASVQIRCVQVAESLGCDYVLEKFGASDIPDEYAVFVCVKPGFWPREMDKLARRGLVVWDIIDKIPPSRQISHYLASTEVAKGIFSHLGPVTVIPHHHCNFSSVPNGTENRSPGWIGNEHWLPKIPRLAFDRYGVSNMGREEVVAAHRKMGIGLNFRSRLPQVFEATQRKIAHEFHVAVNSGIKLINCIGFGIPSVSADEPAYEEIGPRCTITSSLRNCAKWVRALQHEEGLYTEFRRECLRTMATYHIDNIRKKYMALLGSLLKTTARR
jgi:hypothetical protein